MPEQKPFAIRLVEAIERSPLLTDERKLQALNDMNRMYRDQVYASQCGLRKLSHGEPLSRRANFTYHHLWVGSDLGPHFWGKMNEIIGVV